jgi:predicted RND superfamily exporter protein
LGVIAVSCVALIAIPHWTAVIYSAPVVTILYVDLLGVIQFSGLSVNSVTYLGMVLSIGLIVDYTYHILLRYVESKGDSREERVKESLRTIGASVFVGGLSTLLGVVPLAFSSSHIIRIVFIIFIALVTLGLSHGLMLLPVVLSVVGPLNVIPDLNGEDDSRDKADTNGDVLEEGRNEEQDNGIVQVPPESAPGVEGQMDDVPLGRIDESLE